MQKNREIAKEWEENVFNKAWIKTKKGSLLNVYVCKVFLKFIQATMRRHSHILFVFRKVHRRAVELKSSHPSPGLEITEASIPPTEFNENKISIFNPFLTNIRAESFFFFCYNYRIKHIIYHHQQPYLWSSLVLLRFISVFLFSCFILVFRFLNSILSIIFFIVWLKRHWEWSGKNQQFMM